jgi:hypothetical protein
MVDPPIVSEVGEVAGRVGMYLEDASGNAGCVAFEVT